MCWKQNFSGFHLLRDSPLLKGSSSCGHFNTETKRNKEKDRSVGAADLFSPVSLELGALGAHFPVTPAATHLVLLHVLPMEQKQPEEWPQFSGGLWDSLPARHPCWIFHPGSSSSRREKVYTPAPVHHATWRATEARFPLQGEKSQPGWEEQRKKAEQEPVWYTIRAGKPQTSCFFGHIESTEKQTVTAAYVA